MLRCLSGAAAVSKRTAERRRKSSISFLLRVLSGFVGKLKPVDGYKAGSGYEVSAKSRWHHFIPPGKSNVSQAGFDKRE